MNRNIKQKIEEIIKETLKYDEKEEFHCRSLMGESNLGLLILLFNYREIFKDDSFSDKIEMYLTKVIEMPETERLDYSQGLFGLLWFLSYLNNENFIDLDMTELNSYNQIGGDIAITLINSTPSNHDFLSGAIGIGIYLLENIASEEDIARVEGVINSLDKISYVDNKQRYWKDDQYYFKENDPNYSSSVNLGLAHGQPGKIVFLSKALMKGVSPNKTSKILRESVNFLLRCKNKDSSFSNYPNRFLINGAANDELESRLGWCYGDLSICISLWIAGSALKNDEIKNEAVNICLSTLNRKNRAETNINEATICHGAAGVAHIYNRMYKYTNRIEFKEAANFWIQETLKISGLKNDKSFGLLGGMAGTGLVLLSYYSEEEPHWDRCLLLS